jgi:RNA polymerase sigma-70 factor (ECF subfamily)
LKVIDSDDWVEQHGDILYRYALSRVRRHEVAEDLVQETFLSALKSRDQFDGRSTFQTWLVGILRHKILDFFRRAGRESTLDTDEITEQGEISEFFDKAGHWKHPPGDWSSNPQQIFENQEFWAVFQRCLEELPGPVADTFILKELEQVSTDEICKDLQVSATNIWVRMHRARLQLRRCLELNWFSIPP